MSGRTPLPGDRHRPRRPRPLRQVCASSGTTRSLLGNRRVRPPEQVLPAGRGGKSLHVAANLYDWLAAERAERREPLIALGGGVAGDLVGFVAATYARGIPLVQIPTTLLAQIDSSIGGKVAVDLPAGKNLVGAFYPASASSSIPTPSPRSPARSSSPTTPKSSRPPSSSTPTSST